MRLIAGFHPYAWGDRIAITLLAFIPILCLTGFSLPDIAIGILILSALVRFRSTQSFTILFKENWFIYHCVFIFYLLITMYFSVYTSQLQPDDQAPLKVLLSLRMPIFALVMMYYFKYFGVFAFRMFLLGCGVGLAIQMMVLFVEAYQNPEATRLYGTFKVLRPGSYLAVFGLIALTSYYDHCKESLNEFRVALPIFLASAALALACFLTGEVFTNLICIGLMNLYFFVSGIYKQRYYWAILFFVLVAFLGIILFYPNELLVDRFFQIQERAFDSDGDYFRVWHASWLIGLENFWFGSGPWTFKLACTDMLYCRDPLNQPYAIAHHVYLHYFAESGLLGLIGFLILCALVIAYVIRQSKGIPFHYWGLMIVLMTFVFFPLSSQFEPYAQESTMEFWLLLGIAFYYPTYIREVFLKADQTD